MQGRLVAVTAAAAALLSEVGAAPLPATLLTVAQRDRLRSAASPSSASISADGRVIAFASYERLSPDDVDALADIYVLESAAGTVRLESTDADGYAIRTDCLYPRLSGDGRYLVYEAPVLREAGDPRFMDIVFRDRATGRSRRLTVGSSGEDANGWSANAAISDDGTVVVFESSATNLVPGPDVNGVATDVYHVHTPTMRITRVSLDERGEQGGGAASLSPALSGDGRHVVFVSSPTAASRPPPRDPPRTPLQPASRTIYVRDLVRGTTRRLERGGGMPAGGIVGRPALSRDGRTLAFASIAADVVDRDDNRSADVFVADLATGAITLISRNPAGRAANAASGSPSLSADGRLVAFQSLASDLLCTQKCEAQDEDINLVADVFLFDRDTARMTRISAGPAGGWMEESVAPTIDGSGRVLAFTSRHPIDDRDTGHDFDLFVRLADGR